MKSALKQLAGVLAKWAILWAALWYGFRHWVEFSSVQASTLALLFAAAYFWLRDLQKAQANADTFRPFHVSISVHNCRDLLLGFKLLNSTEEWEEFREKALEGHNVLRHGINFTVLSLNNEGWPNLIYWDDHKTFLSEMELEESINGIELVDAELLTREHKWSPRLYFGKLGESNGHAGYGLGLVVRSNWWKATAKGNSANAEPQEDNYSAGTLYLPIAILPCGELGLHYGKGKREEELKKRGWECKDFHAPEIGMHESRVEQKYFEVRQRYA